MSRPEIFDNQEKWLALYEAGARWLAQDVDGQWFTSIDKPIPSALTPGLWNVGYLRYVTGCDEMIFIEDAIPPDDWTQELYELVLVDA